jgi:transposase
MDNLAAHHIEGVRARIEGIGAQLWYLPPYSPDFNPIELSFAKLKTLLRAARSRNAAITSAIAAIRLLHAHEKCASRVSANHR